MLWWKDVFNQSIGSNFYQIDLNIINFDNCCRMGGNSLRTGKGHAHYVLIHIPLLHTDT